ncbi:MAG: bifunctional hydroxymethylpyrimidine kinase/phosphomethylpyrimidine kinase [Kiritimatiellia bacterium]
MPRSVPRRPERPPGHLEVGFVSRRIEPCALTIAGSDSGGNAGVQADLRAFHCYGVHGCTVFAALTAQNPRGVRSVLPVPAAFIEDQLDAVFEMYGVRALKTGMLATAEAIEAVAGRLRRRQRVKKVVDPVMVATSGAKLLADDAVEALKERLLPLATLITPNLPEAEALLGRPVASGAEMWAAARELAKTYGCAVLVKGGHAVRRGAAVEDVLFDGRRIHVFSKPAIEHSVSTHGTGCSLAAALAAELALGASLAKAVEGAKNFVYDAIRLSYHVGRNCGVLGMPRER